MSLKDARRLPLLVVLLLAVLPLTLIGTYLCIREYRHQTNVALERRGSIADMGAVLIHEKFRGIIDVGTSLALRPLVYRNIEKDDWDEAVKNIDGIPQVFPYIDTIGLFDTEGVLKATIPPMPEAIGKSFAYRDYYQGVSREWKPYVSEAFKRAVEPKYNVVSIAVPIKSLDQKVLGILLLTVKIDAIVSWTKYINVGSSGSIFVVDKKGQLIAHHNLDLEDDLVDYSALPSIKRLLQGEHGVDMHKADVLVDEDHIAAYAFVKDYGFGIEVVQPTRTAFAERDNEVIVLCIIWVFIIGIIGFFLYRILKDREEIREQRDRERLLLSGIGDGIVAIDRDWRITLWNKAAGRITGWTEAEVLGKPFRSIVKFIRENNRKEDIAFIENAILMKETSFLDVGTLLIKKDGSEVAVGDSAAPINDRNGDTKGAIIVFRDASKEREAMHMRSEFVYASHQLRTPVTEALWNLDIAKKEDDPIKRAEDLDIVGHSLMSIQKLSEHLVAVSEIDQGSISVKKSMTKITDVFGEIQNILEKKAEGGKITLSFGPVSVAAAFDTDPKLFKKALHEVIDNAILYSPAGSDVKINTAIKENNIIIEVADTGVGIPEAEQPVIFSKFFRASSRPKNVAGAGLGLYIAREYIKVLGGKIWFDSVEGKGTTFFISLPIV